ncbi:matrixin family metalloprotease [Haladaptatus sp. CMAA 1911]|uniref:matrixin family metalloprotease n=1 Tax=unclassified Haladaptatus TaxID=2622732 RepID=UPI0037553A29
MPQSKLSFVLIFLILTAGCAGKLEEKPTTQTSSTEIIESTLSTPSPSPTTTSSTIDRTTTSEITTTLATTTAASVPDNPWEKEEIVVQVKNQQNNRNFKPLVRKALDYWEENDSRYGDYEINYTVTTDSRDPDITVEFVQDIPICGDSFGVLGCAPLINGTNRVYSMETVQIEVGYTNHSTLQTLKHEFGHTHGLEHGDEPMPLMNASGEVDDLPMPNVDERDLPWQSEQLSVFVDYSNVSNFYRDDYKEQIQHTLNYYDEGADGTVPKAVSFQTTENRSAADIVIDFPDSVQCGDSSEGSCGSFWGISPDADDELEFYTQGYINVAGIDEDAIGWHVGYWLGYAFEGVPEDLAPPFQDADYDDRRDDWWD